MTDWYSHLAVAARMQVPPWVLDGMDDTRACIMWRQWAIASMNAEGAAQKSKEKQAR